MGLKLNNKEYFQTYVFVWTSCANNMISQWTQVGRKIVAANFFPRFRQYSVLNHHLNLIQIPT